MAGPMILLYAICAVAIGWALRELVWLRRMRRKLERIEHSITLHYDDGSTETIETRNASE